LRWFIVRATLLVAVAVLGGLLYRLSDPFRSPPDDFVAFWSSARLFVAGANPYDADELLRVERSANWTKDHAYRVWEPPWALVAMAPLAALSYQDARFIWFVLHLALLVAAADRLWLYYGGDRARRGVAWIAAVTFAPAVIGWRTGQLTVLVLAGVVAFLGLERRGRLGLATAAFVVLASIKPHVVYLFCFGLGLWTVAARRWRVGGVALVVAALLVGVPWAMRPSVLGDFLTTMVQSPPYQPASTIGTVLREISTATVGRDFYPLVFLPPAFGTAWLVRRWVRRREGWRWESETPLLVAVSLLTAPFAWIYDAVLLLVPVICALVPVLQRADRRRSRAVLWGYGAINVGVFAQNVADVHPFLYFWVPTALLIWYASATRGQRVS